jgi:molybdenum cofactor guanylyltransferase
MTPSPLAGLVLTGGQSRRMGTDKATLKIAGESQLARAVRLLGTHCAEVHVSVREDQRRDPDRAAYPQIVDRPGDVGPAAGILAALESMPDRAWLVAAVDLPLLDAATIASLIAQRDADGLATAFKSSHDGLPEPLCAIWEPASLAPLRAFVDGGRHCPRKFLLTHPVRLLDLIDAEALSNANTPEDFAALVRDDGSETTP